MTRHDKAVARLVPQGAHHGRRGFVAALKGSGFDDDRTPGSLTERCARPSTTEGHDTAFAVDALPS
jgi:antitoxin (DNA-binding transcriptional repressor) of toxin-antitoxin stability system